MSAADVYERLARAHCGDLEDPRYSVEGLDIAACGAQVKHVAQYGIAAADHGVDAATWRESIITEAGPEAAAVVADAEECMRASGLWPWR